MSSRLAESDRWRTHLVGGRQPRRAAPGVRAAHRRSAPAAAARTGGDNITYRFFVTRGRASRGRASRGRSRSRKRASSIFSLSDSDTGFTPKSRRRRRKIEDVRRSPHIFSGFTSSTSSDSGDSGTIHHRNESSDECRTVEQMQRGGRGRGSWGQRRAASKILCKHSCPDKLHFDVIF